ncbi:nitrate- and nitrite sensing domain-containing protein [Bradyrhizobium oligotrophicum]|uniref:nitrate- and nitrite sensing domain-containing protein n=1 Tax=Bradyrhizobium oligotrophicum TaxID=44255 RepID=UPI003EB8CD08
MFRLLANHSIGIRVAAVGAIPTVAFLFLAAANLAEAIGGRDEALEVGQICAAMPLVSGLVDSVQRERGLTLLALSTESSLARENVLAQRRRTDLALQSVKQEVAALEELRPSSEQINALRNGLGAERALAELRLAVDRRSIDGIEAVERYARIVDDVSAVIYHVAYTLKNSATTRQLIGLVALAESQEQAGLERAFGGRGFATQQFEPKTFEEFVRFRGGQQGFMKLASNLIGGPAGEALARIPNADESKIVEDMRELAGRSLSAPLAQPVTPMRWFDAASARIELIKAAKLQLAKQVKDDAHAIVADATGKLRALAISILLMLAGVGAALWTVIRSITRPITELVSDANRLASGDMSVKFEAVERQDEIGIVARAIARFRDNVEREERLRNEFIATVSHELRTPLTAISGAIGLVTGMIAKSQPSPVSRLLGIALANCKRLVRIVNDILDINKIDSGTMVFELGVVDVRQLIQQSIDASHEMARGASVKLVLDDGAVSAMVMADPDRLVQVITNLLSNAIKFSPPDSEVNVNVTRRAGTVQIAVRDHGKGIPSEFKERIFEKFVQIDATDHREKGGIGLGLSIAKQIMIRLGGNIEFEAAPGGGTIFCVSLPEWRDAPARSASGLNLVAGLLGRQEGSGYVSTHAAH